ncbi:MAG: porin family protein [Alphaproteobacteria bacterium]|nr:porin family protein [Alphaproteobacteria bacterium]
MKNAFLTALMTTAIMGAALANSPSPAFSGVYIGGGFNYTNEKVTSNGGNNVSLSGGGIKGFLGIGSVFFEGLYLGGEVGIGYDQIFRNKKKSGIKDNKTNYVMAARVGYAINTYLPFVKFGYEGRAKSGSIRRSGVLAGGGVDIALTKNVFVRLEYDHKFGSKSAVMFNGKQLSFRDRADTFFLGAGYRY